MAPTLCNRCGDAVVEERCDPRDELAELDALLKRFILKRYDLKRKINRFYSPIIRLLPPDVMSTVFEFCLSDFTDYQPYPTRSEKLFTPLSLGAISSYWRGIAWSTPTLWSSLVVRDPSRYEPHIVTSMAKEWLDRSGRLPLSIRILSTLDNDNESVSALVDIINQYSNRWFDLHLILPYQSYQLFHATNNQAPILKSIRLHSNTIAIASNLNFQLTCPRLERAILLDFPIHGTNIQWDNLTHLTFSSTSMFDFFLILRKTPRLVFCEVSGYYISRRFEGEGKEAIILTSLRSLHLEIYIDADKLLDNLNAPHLEEFSLPMHHYDLPTENITSFLRRSACSLRSLSMSFTEYSERYMNLLQSIPSLNTLSIQSIAIGTSAIAFPDDHDSRNIFRLVAKVLSSQSTSLRQGFLPNLKILEYTGELYYLPSGNYYEDLYPLPPVDNAVHGPLQLLSFDFHSITRVPKKIISYISSLEERGVTVNVLSYSENILQSSIDYYKCKEDFLCRDWTENFDSTLFS